MRYSLSLLALLALLGAGCATETPSSSQDKALPDKSATDVETGDDGTVDVTTQDGITAVLGQKNDSNPSQEESEEQATQTEDGVPLTEVMLGEEPDVKVDVEMGNYFVTPSTITVKPGAKVGITFTKVTGIHTFVIDALNLNFSPSKGERLNFTAPSQPGKYPYYCDIGSHRSFGLEGTLIVE